MKEQLGHATILTTQRYAHVLPHSAKRTGGLLGEIMRGAETAAEAAAKAKPADNVTQFQMAADA